MRINLKLLSDNAFIPISEKDIELVESLKKNVTYSVDVKNLDSYTTRQNRALHLWFTQIANHFNFLQIPISIFHKKKSLWTLEIFKELFYRPVLKSVTKKSSTTQLEKQEFTLIVETFIKAFAMRGVELPEFPNREMLK